MCVRMDFMAKIVVFSDTHLTNKFDEKKFRFLKEIISGADQVIINGDFWDGSVIEFDKFINSPWKELFPLLKNKNTVYIYGNHDRKNRADGRTFLFSNKQTELYEFASGDKTFIFEHGNRLKLGFDRVVDFLNLPKFTEYIFDFWENAMFKILGKKFSQWFYQRFNNELKRKIKNEIKENAFFVFGHTHCAEIDLKNHFINGGFVRHGLGQYLVIEDGQIHPKERWYSIN
jgi:predicted phosphodiesterase